MTDAPRHADQTTERPSGGDSRVESLLTEGLGHYFEGRFEDAIHLWTRVLFLDRHHASARAYIERARGAIAERQRRADESLQAVTGLLDSGRAAEARARLTQVITITGDDERTAALRLRLERLERVSGGAHRIHAVPVPTTVWWHRGLAWAGYRVRLRHVAVVSFVVCLGVLWSSPAIRTRVGFQSAQSAPVIPPAAVPVPVLSGGEVALIRARALYARGRLADALAVLDRVGTEQNSRPDADRLRVEIQRVLLAAADDPARRGAR
jgi:tetratricopeptide (TPR) repeat protein